MEHVVSSCAAWHVVRVAQGVCVEDCVAWGGRHGCCNRGPGKGHGGGCCCDLVAAVDCLQCQEPLPPAVSGNTACICSGLGRVSTGLADACWW
jgi:hypothetical protein